MNIIKDLVLNNSYLIKAQKSGVLLEVKIDYQLK